MLAIPVLKSRVAPVLNWCSTVLILPGDATEPSMGQDLAVDHLLPFDLLRTLRERGVSTLICGALTRGLLSYGESLGLEIIHGVAGSLNEVLSAYRERILDRPHFRLPGCQKPCCHRRLRVCPQCGMEVSRLCGVSSSWIRCPECGCPVTPKD